MSCSDWIQFAMTIITLIGVIVSLIISIVTLRQNKNIIEESNRAYLLFYIDYNPQIDMYFLIIKNFGKSIGKLISLEVAPELDWSKTTFKQEISPLTKAKDILLAPNQKVSSWFEFNEYPDKEFDIKITYSSNNKVYTDKYKINLDYIENIDWLAQYPLDDKTDDNKEVLYKINNSIRDLTDKFR
ncbi:MAG: hypothetical protein GX951_01385 [Mollicutes bacterium]|nr:hypothetical protein [Mollicutes bacterium]